MWSLAYITLLGFPSVGVLAAYAAALHSWQRTLIRFPPSPDVRGSRGKITALMALPIPLVVFGLVLLFLLFGEEIPETLAQPAALAYGVPAFLSGLGVAIIYTRGFTPAVFTKEGFGRVMLLAILSLTSAIFGLVISFLLIGGASNPAKSTAWTTDTVWLTSALSMIGGMGSPISAWFAVSAWDFKTKETWPRAGVRSARGGYLTAVCFTVAMALLQEWLLLLFMVLYFGAIIALGIGLFFRARHKRLRGMKPS